MTEIEGYKVVPLRLYPSAQNCHSVFMKEHFIRLMDPNKPKGRTLFLLNIPPYVTEKSLEIFFDRIGSVISTSFAEKPGRDETYNWSKSRKEFSSKESPFKFKVAYVVFKTTNNMERALQITSIDLFNNSTGESIVESGMQLWHSHYQQQFLDAFNMKNCIDEYISAYDKREKEAEALQNSVPDADGWVTVGKQGRNSGFEQKDAVIGKLEEKLERGKKKKELTNFYTFQMRESKMKNIIELRKKFEDDKRKIESLKLTRRFKPF